MRDGNLCYGTTYKTGGGAELQIVSFYSHFRNAFYWSERCFLAERHFEHRVIHCNMLTVRPIYFFSPFNVSFQMFAHARTLSSAASNTILALVKCENFTDRCHSASNLDK